MRSRIPIAVLFLSISLAICLGPVHASFDSSSIFAVNVSPDSVQVSISIGVLSNLTATQGNLTLPQFHGVLQGSNATGFSSQLQNVLQAGNSHPTVGFVRLETTSSAVSMNNVQTENVSLSFQVRGVSVQKNGISAVDLSWKSFIVKDNVSIASFEANHYGAYLAVGAQQLASQGSRTTGSGATFIRKFVIDNVPESARQFPAIVAAHTFMNFSRLGTPISTWQRSFDLTSNTVTWTLSSPVRLGIEVYDTTIELGNLVSKVHSVLLYFLQSKITAPFGSTVSGDTVSIESSAIPIVMGLAIVIPAVVAVGSFGFERRITRNKKVRKKPRR